MPQFTASEENGYCKSFLQQEPNWFSIAAKLRVAYAFIGVNEDNARQFIDEVLGDLYVAGLITDDAATAPTPQVRNG